MAEQPTCRGYVFQSAKAYMESAYDESTRKSICDRLSPQTRHILETFDKVAWYPIAHAVDIFSAIARHHMETDKKPEKALVELGRTIAETATNTFLRLLLKFMTVPLFSRKIPDFWVRDNRCGTLTTESLDVDAKRMTFLHAGIRDYDYMGSVAPGFLCYALEAIGCKNVRFESDWRIEQPGPDVVRYQVTWD